MLIIERKASHNISVVAGILIDNRNFLISSRPKKKDYEGFWEFPGGKVNYSESKEEALYREIKEELNTELVMDSIRFFNQYIFSFPKYKVSLNFYFCKKWNGSIIPMEGQKVKWIKATEISQYEFLPSNNKVLKKIINELD